MTGTIFDIQRFSIYDGPGIRTNVFFKGCNLRCQWCHNPESQSVKPQLMFYSEKCVGCGKCAELCGNTFTENCTACGRCVSVCAHGARKVSGRTADADEIVAAVLKDKEYYKTSGGGVTLSGGEPLLQADFAAEILRKCKENGIHTAIETAAHVPWTAFEKTLPFLDLVLCDIKAADDGIHRQYTGVSNALILQNVKKLMESGTAVRFRTPVIPGINDKEPEKIAKLIRGADYELLAYHTTGVGKYAALNKEYDLDGVEPPAAEEVQKTAELCGAAYYNTGI